VIGETIGHFEITARAGRGGMGEVFVAEHTAIRTRVAIKVLHAEVSASTDHVQRFFNEARAVARIQHAGIARIFDVGVHASGRAYLIMEYLEGETLGARLARLGRLSARSTAEIARQIASILDATHRAGIVHRDLKPANVFLVGDHELAAGERVKLLDFGIAKLSGALTSAGPTTVGAIGTPAYMAPEQWNDSSAVDWRADVYSLGCIAYEMAAGRPPFGSASIAEACARHLTDTPAPIRRHAPEVPAAAEALVLRLLAKDPAERVASTELLEQQFAALIDASGDGTWRSLPLDVKEPGEPGEPGEPREPGAPGADPAPTTLSGEASMAPAVAHRRVRTSLAIAAIVAIGGLIAWRVARPGDRGSVASSPPPAAASGSGAAPAAPRSDPREHTLAEWIETANPFLAWRGAQWLSHQVTRREYRRFLESLPVNEALRRQPVTGWDDREPMRPVGWVTFERAAAFCRAIHASLPTSEQWTAASDGAWGLDPAGIGRPGPLQEWTATVRDGLVVVRGGHERMSAADRATAAVEPLMKSSEAQAGPDAAPNIVASETIGFRCVR
jgi:tRNA A-37 threonylcarbamoyl transferase component Bud32